MEKNMEKNIEKKIVGLDPIRTRDFSWMKQDGKIIYSYVCEAKGIYGLGERYCSVNHKGKVLINKVFEKFTQQGEHTYLPLPFYHGTDGHGVFVDTAYEVAFRFEEGRNKIEIDEEADHTLYFYYGSPSDIVEQFVKQTGQSLLPPKWAFGVWASANRWNSQKHIEEQLELIKENNYPVSVLVIEAWSDEATFYIWNGATYKPVAGSESFKLSDFEFHEPWKNPMGMIEAIHEEGMRLVLWQIPVLKELDPGQVSRQHEEDCAFAVQNQLVATNPDGTPYGIPKQWFIGSMLPDFMRTETCNWWHEKRNYLLEEMGVDGFKTDGGEFVHEDETLFYGQREGKQVRNLYPAQYEEAYEKMVGPKRVLFSRAGYIGAQKTPFHWAGDQLSTFSELKAVLRAGLSLSLCGVPFWSFDIAGFAGALPSKELYLRATALAAFAPAMQWHSEPAGGQFSEILKGIEGTNDRSPWNMAKVLQDEEILKVATFFANLHMNFLPHLYSEAIKACEQGLPLMRHLVFDASEDERSIDCEDEYRIGDLLVAPVVEEGKKKRKIYLPQGNWYDLWEGTKYQGRREIEMEVPFNRIPLFLKEEGAIAVNVDEQMLLGTTIGNNVEEYNNLCIVYGGDYSNYQFRDEKGTRPRNYIAIEDFAKRQRLTL